MPGYPIYSYLDVIEKDEDYDEEEENNGKKQNPGATVRKLQKCQQLVETYNTTLN